MPSESLKKYHKKRDFKKTPEPKKSSSKKKSQKSIFVIQKHQATKLHYDLRIQSGKVLKSWAVPKGPSMNPKIKRLAVSTEDHPLDYADFEGNIPKDEYGGGTIIIWDKGEYENLRDISIKKSYDDGRININLKGKKVKGGFSLVKTGKNWLLIKIKDAQADSKKKIVKSKPKSVLSNKSLKQVKNEKSKKKK